MRYINPFSQHATLMRLQHINISSLKFVMCVIRHSGLSCFWHHLYTCVVLSVDMSDYCCYAFGEQGSLKYVKIFIVVSSYT